MAVHREVLAHRQAPRHVDVGRGEVHPAERPVAVPAHVVPQHLDGPRCRRDQPEQHADGRRLAGAVAAEQRHGARALDREAHRLDRPHGTEPLAEIDKPGPRDRTWQLSRGAACGARRRAVLASSGARGGQRRADRDAVRYRRMRPSVPSQRTNSLPAPLTALPPAATEAVWHTSLRGHGATFGGPTSSKQRRKAQLTLDWASDWRSLKAPRPSAYGTRVMPPFLTFGPRPARMAFGNRSAERVAGGV